MQNNSLILEELFFIMIAAYVSTKYCFKKSERVWFLNFDKNDFGNQAVIKYSSKTECNYSKLYNKMAACLFWDMNWMISGSDANLSNCYIIRSPMPNAQFINVSKQQHYYGKSKFCGCGKFYLN